MATPTTQPAFPFTIEDLPDEDNANIKRDFKGYLSGAVRVAPKGYFFQGIYRNYAHLYYNLPVRPTDVFVASYPKCGTTWTQEMVWLLVNDLDYQGATKPLDDRFPFVEADHVLDAEVLKNLPGAKGVKPHQPGERCRMVEGLKDPRCIKTHMPFSLLTPALLDTCKVVYVARDPRDVLVSYYHHHRMWATHGFHGDFKAFFNYFIKEQVMWSPFWSHVREAWDLRDRPNLLFITYNQLKQDLPAVIARVANFLGKEITLAAQEKLAEHLGFDAMKANPAVNAVAEADTGLLNLDEGGFIRKGKSGQWQQYCDDEMRQQLDEWMAREGGDLAKELGWV